VPKKRRANDQTWLTGSLSRRAEAKSQPEAMVAELRDYLNLRYDGEATVATEIGVESSSLADWLVGKSSTHT
jgi:hypothetical protein